MDYYVDFRVLADPEFTACELLNALFAKCHRALPRLTEGRVGVSFPGYRKTLGDCLRLHGSQADLQAMLADSWLKGLRDYVRFTGPQPVPSRVSYRTVRRVQAKSAHNKRRRSIAKGWLSEEEALARIPDNQQKVMKLPFLEIRSLSTNNRMRVWIEHGPLQNAPVGGAFNAYGLSAVATVPWFGAED